jgi:hypothetical protein
MDEKAARLRAHLANIDRYERLLQSKLNATELRFVERRLSEERFTLAMLQFMSQRNSESNITIPDALQ